MFGIFFNKVLVSMHSVDLLYLINRVTSAVAAVKQESEKSAQLCEHEMTVWEYKLGQVLQREEMCLWG